VQTRERYGRLLAHVYLPDGEMFNEEVVGAEYAQPVAVPPNVKYEIVFLRLSKEARDKRRGLWR
jgi:micrococcal nuclease